jgi:GTPase SAR1 family protein
MGNGKSICDSIGLKRQLTVLFVGLDNSGKTCASRALCGGNKLFISPIIIDVLNASI